MGLVKKLKDILFEEEDELTEPIKINDDLKKDEPKIVKIEPEKEEPVVKASSGVPSERELFKNDNSFHFPDFDEEEFASSVELQRPRTNVLEYERKRTSQRTPEYSKVERTSEIEKKKFKPSPIISPVYGILNQDYKAEDIIDKKDVASNIDIDVVRKKAFETEKIEAKEEKSIIDEPVVTFFEEKSTEVIPDVKEDSRSIDDLLEEASTEIDLEDTIEIPKTNNIEAIEDELEKLDHEEKNTSKDLDNTSDNDLFELIDSMYEEREEE